MDEVVNLLNEMQKMEELLESDAETKDTTMSRENQNELDYPNDDKCASFKVEDYENEILSLRTKLKLAKEKIRVYRAGGDGDNQYFDGDVGFFITPLSNLAKVEDGYWTLKTRLVERSNIIHLHPEGKMMTVKVSDDSGELCMTVFDNNIDALLQLELDEGVIYISNRFEDNEMFRVSLRNTSHKVGFRQSSK